MTRVGDRVISSSAAATLVEAARDDAPVSGLTHNFYRYPARFSPKLVRSAIQTFTEPGDWVLDPFVGGGTTLVEALASGRNSVGSDISSLATFIAEVKTTLYREREMKDLATWASEAPGRINLHAPSESDHEYAQTGYLRHMNRESTWRLRKAIEQVLATARGLDDPRLESFARCVVLRTAQWALNGRKRLPSLDEFRRMLQKDAVTMLEGTRALRDAVRCSSTSAPHVHCLNRSTNGLESDKLFRGGRRKPKLIVTSPPYPGVHVLYHRWQVDGRKETPAPFWIADRRDGDGAAYYTMGARNTQELNSYFANLRASLNSVAALCSEDTVIVQVVAFSEPEWQLPRYLSVADDAGLSEFRLSSAALGGDGRLWRTVPHRKWYADQRGTTSGSQEVVLFHRRRA